MKHSLLQTAAGALTILVLVTMLAGCTANAAGHGVTGIMAQDHLSNAYPNATFSMFLSSTDAMLALQNGKVDYVMTSRPTAYYMMKQDANLVITRDNVVDEACYIAVSKERSDLKEAVDAVLTGYKQTVHFSYVHR